VIFKALVLQALYNLSPFQLAAVGAFAFLEPCTGSPPACPLARFRRGPRRLTHCFEDSCDSVGPPIDCGLAEDSERRAAATRGFRGQRVVGKRDAAGLKRLRNLEAGHEGARIDGLKGRGNLGRGAGLSFGGSQAKLVRSDRA
jgi:hypothetical protein